MKKQKSKNIIHINPDVDYEKKLIMDALDEASKIQTQQMKDAGIYETFWANHKNSCQSS